MTSLKRCRRAALVVVLAVLVSPALSGCVGNPIVGLVEQATGGTVDVGGQEIPDGFPTEVPLAAGDVIFGISAGEGDNRGFNVTISAGAQSPLAGIETQFADVGFESQVQASGAEGVGSLIFTSADWNVIVVVTKVDTGYTANYTVSRS
ncbi:MAG: hypothetical protein ACOH1K_00485 [Rhodoglobus sp.]